MCDCEKRIKEGNLGLTGAVALWSHKCYEKPKEVAKMEIVEIRERG